MAGNGNGGNGEVEGKLDVIEKAVLVGKFFPDLTNPAVGYGQAEIVLDGSKTSLVLSPYKGGLSKSGRPGFCGSTKVVAGVHRYQVSIQVTLIWPSDGDLLARASKDSAK